MCVCVFVCVCVCVCVHVCVCVYVHVHVCAYVCILKTMHMHPEMSSSGDFPYQLGVSSISNELLHGWLIGLYEFIDYLTLIQFHIIIIQFYCNTAKHMYMIVKKTHNTVQFNLREK